MASGISYPIQGKYNPKGEKDAINGIKKMTDAAKTFNLAVKGFVVAKVIQGINKVVNGSTEAFKNQNKAIVNFNKAVSNNAKLTNESLGNLNKTMSDLSRNNFFDGDSLNNAAAFASNLGLAENQIKDVLSAATDLAAATGQDLNSAVKTLSESYAGNVGQLGKLNPAIKNLTKEELANGEAVKLIQKQYEGFADTMANTFSGRDTQFANAFSDLQASVGGIIQAAKFGLEGILMRPLNKITGWITENRETIIKFLYGLPDILKVVGKTGFEIIKKTFTSEGMANLFSFLGKSLLIYLKASLTATFELIRGLFEDILTLLDFVFGNTWRNLQDLLGRLGNKLVDTLNTAFQKVLSAPGVKQLYEWLSGNKAANTQVISFKFKTDHAKENLSWKDVTSTFDANFKKLVSTYKTEVQNGIAAETKALKEFASFYSDLTDEAVSQIKDILSKDLPEDVKQAMVAGIVEANSETSTNTVISDSATNIDSGVSNASKGLQKLTSIIQALGDVGQAVALALSQNWIGLILMLIAKLVSALEGISDSFSAFTDSISTIMGIVAEIIKPVVEDSIKPFLDGMQNLGTIIGELLSPIIMLLNEILVPILNSFTQSLDFIAPIVKLVGTLLKLFIQMNPVLKIFVTTFKIFGDILKAVYNYVLVPVVNFLLKIITAIGNFFIRMYNGVVGVLNSIEIFGWRPFNLSKKSELDYGSMKLERIDKYSSYEGGNSSDGSSGGSSNSRGSASYTAARDTFVNIYFSNSFINGDSEQIAIMLAREIKRAEAKNLI